MLRPRWKGTPTTRLYLRLDGPDLANGPDHDTDVELDPEKTSFGAAGGKKFSDPVDKPAGPLYNAISLNSVQLNTLSRVAEGTAQ